MIIKLQYSTIKELGEKLERMLGKQIISMSQENNWFVFTIEDGKKIKVKNLF